MYLKRPGQLEFPPEEGNLSFLIIAYNLNHQNKKNNNMYFTHTFKKTKILCDPNSCYL